MPSVGDKLSRQSGLAGVDYSHAANASTRLSAKVKSDFWDWEMAQDGIETMRVMLSECRGVL
ncbi:MAG: hypothetical protein JXA33_04990 [Anaerolineae bacterium]|nr:hypothetical protein [Anaerolineae bacterium]